MTTNKSEDKKNNTHCSDTKAWPCDIEQMAAMMRRCFSGPESIQNGSPMKHADMKTMWTMMGRCCDLKKDPS